MAICGTCNGEMLAVLTCLAEQRPNVTYYGQDINADWYRDLAPTLPSRCRDCGVAHGGLHHPGCCVAQCTRCDDQRLGCGCDDEKPARTRVQAPRW